MLGLLLLTAVLVGACFTVGQGALALCGWKTWRWWSPAVGLSILIIVGGQSWRFPRHGTVLSVVMIVLALAPLLLGSVRSALREALPDALPLGLILLLAAAVPFFATGHAGILGASVSDDMSQHLSAAFFLRTREGMLPMAALGGNLINTGYPLGPHGLTAELTRIFGLGEVRSFDAVTLAIPIITAFTALALVPRARRAARWALAAVVGLGYLPAAFLAQGSFKETLQALLLLAVAVALNELAQPESPRSIRRGLPIGLFLGASIYTYSYGGAFWIVGATAFFVFVELVRRPRELRATFRHWLMPVVGALVAGAVLVLPELHRILDFKNSIFGVEPKRNHGDLFHALNPLETVGVWLSGDFRINPNPSWLSVGLCVLALIVLVLGLVWWWRRNQLAIPAAIVVAIVIWIDLAVTRNIYNAAKGLIVLAPLVMACIGAPLAAAWGADAPLRSRSAIRAAKAVGIVLFVAAIVSTAGVLRWAPVGVGGHEQELASLRPLLQNKNTLVLTNENFAQWQLRGAKTLYTSYPLYRPAKLKMRKQKSGHKHDPIDVDNYSSRALDKLDYVLTYGGAFQSQFPPNFKLVRQTPSFKLYRRVGPTPARFPLESTLEPGTLMRCSTHKAKAFLAKYRWAGVLPRPVVRTNWEGSTLFPGDSAKLHVRLPRGRWDVSLQYAAVTDVDASAPGLHTTLPANFSVTSAYWPVGTVTSPGGPLTLHLQSHKRSWFGQLIGRQASPVAPGFFPLAQAVFTRHGVKPQRVSAAKACGHYVDWFAPAASKMR